MIIKSWTNTHTNSLFTLSIKTNIIPSDAVYIREMEYNKFKTIVIGLLNREDLVKLKEAIDDTLERI